MQSAAVVAAPPAVSQFVQIDQSLHLASAAGSRAVAPGDPAVSPGVSAAATTAASTAASAAGTTAAPDRPAADAALPLTDLPRDVEAEVLQIRLDPDAGDAGRQLALRLAEIGCVPGERVRVLAWGWPGRDPLSVRIGGPGGRSTFALRRREAACVQVVVVSR